MTEEKMTKQPLWIDESDPTTPQWEGVIRWPSGEMYITEPYPDKNLALWTAQGAARGSGGAAGRSVWTRRVRGAPSYG